MNDPMNDTPSAMPPPEPPPPVDSAASNDERQWALFTHLSALLGFLIPFGNVLGPLIFWQLKKNESAFIDDQGKEALNFQITFTLVMLALITLGTVLLIIIIGFVFYIAAFVAGIAWLVLTILAGIRANNGEHYRYPWTWRPIK
jgi:uncharacterized Tic20 family protein